nr:hypothetical protein [Tanacetum cinerariifolium]
MAEPVGDVTLRWKAEEELLLAKCSVAVSEDRNVGRSQPKDTLWFRVLNEFNRKNFQKRTKDMLSSKWTSLNHHCQKFNAIYKNCHRLKKSGENEVDLMKRARGIYRDENKNNSFNHEDACNSSSQFGEFMSHELRLKREAAEKAFEVSKEKDRTITRLEELRFLALSTKDLDDNDAYWIELQKNQIKAKSRAQMLGNSNNNNDVNETDDDE